MVTLSTGTLFGLIAFTSVISAMLGIVVGMCCLK